MLYDYFSFGALLFSSEDGAVPNCDNMYWHIDATILTLATLSSCVSPTRTEWLIVTLMLLFCFPQLTENERRRADTAAQQLMERLAQIEQAMSDAAGLVSNLSRDPCFIGVRSRLSVLKQQVIDYRVALHDNQTTPAL